MQVVPWGCNSHRLGYAAPTGMVKYHHLLVELHLLVYSMLAAVAATQLGGSYHISALCKGQVSIYRTPDFYGLGA